MKIAIGGIKQETNCFSSVPTPRTNWKCWEKEEILQLRGTGNNEIGGIFQVADRLGWEILPTFHAETRPAQPTDRDTYEWIRTGILEPIRQHSEELDGVILCFHGAMTVPGVSDPESDIAAEVRSIIGNKPFMITLDLHANNTEQTVRCVDAVFGYDTNPHIDIFDRGVECAECMAKALSGEWKPVTAHRHPPLILPTINMRTAEGPMRQLMERAKSWESRENMINVSVFGGFTYADCSYTGFNVVATADGDSELAQDACDDICTLAWSIREAFIKDLLPIPTAMNQAKELLAKKTPLPVILADVADNSGSGGSSDTTMLLHAMIDADLPGTAVGYIWDPETVRRALEVGLGRTAQFSIGGKFHDYGEPVKVEATVRAITDGVCRCYGPIGRGDEYNFGTGVRLQTGNVHICVYTVRFPGNFREMFLNLGIDPACQRLLLIKSRGHFRADFEPISSHIIEVDAPGAANPNIVRYPYKHAYGWPITPEVQDWSI